MSPRRLLFLAAALLAPVAPARAQETAPRPRIVYGGDARFAPYDHLAADGTPTGFNVELMRRLGQEAGVDVEIRLDTWNNVRAAFDDGRIDIISLSHSEERRLAYDWLAQTWWMHQCVVFQPGRRHYPASPADLAGEIIAAQERSAVAERLFVQAPPKPSLITVRTQDDALDLLERGTATGVGGNSLSLRVAAAQRGMGELVEMPLRAVPYGYMAKKGRAAELDWVQKGVARLRESGALEALAERHLAVPAALHTGRDHTWLAAVFLGLAFVLALAAAFWHRARLVAVERQARGERERLSSALELAGAEWQRTVDAVDTCVLILDGHGRIKRVNRAARELLGQDDSAILDRHVEQLEAVEPWVGAGRLLKAAARLGSPSSAEATDTLGGRTWDLTIFGAAHPEAADQRLILVVRDITGMVALRGALRRSEAMSALGSLVAGVAHEIRNPLFSISATLDALEDEFGNRAEYAEFANPLRAQLGRLTRLTRDLLDYGRSPTLKPSRIKVRDLLGAAVDASADQARERGVHLLQEVVPSLPPLELDAGRMAQVLENLIANAVQHSPRGRTVRIAARLGAVAETLELSVADQGLGLADDDIPRLFEPFFSRREGGTGLGLSIVQRIVESHGGQVSAANQRSGGAVFTVTVPLCLPLAIRSPSMRSSVLSDDGAPTLSA